MPASCITAGRRRRAISTRPPAPPNARSRHHAWRLERDLARVDDEFRELSRIGMALVHEHDRSALIKLIVGQGKQLTESDGAGLLFLRYTPRGDAELHAVAYEIDTLPHLGLPDITFPVDGSSIVGHAALIKQLLAQIPWTDDLRNLVTYAYGHHEKLNGTGYPRRLTSADIPVQTRMITLADIFDALTEADRPYKPAVTTEQALDIIRAEAKAGQLDADLVAIMTDSRAYSQVIGTDWKQL